MTESERQALIREIESVSATLNNTKSDLKANAAALRKLAQWLETKPDKVILDGLTEGSSVTNLERIGSESFRLRDVDVREIGVSVQRVRQCLRRLAELERLYSQNS